MQYVDEKSLFFREIVGKIIQELRVKKAGTSRNKFSNEYALNDSNLGKIERALIDCKFITLWKIIEALDVNFIDFISRLQKELGEDFTLIDE